MAAKDNVQALLFDVFGTVVDWRTSLIEDLGRFGAEKGLKADWATFADDWRGLYQPAMDEVRNGRRPWTILDVLHRESLDKLIAKYGFTGLGEADRDHMNRVWHRLKPWPDSVAGLTRLKKKYTIAPLSNGNVALLTDMAKHSGLPWDAILGAELVRHYKPDREVYLSAAEFLGVKPAEVMMCAAHSGDLMAARNQGLRTGFIHRPDEYGPTRRADTAKPEDFDVVAKDILDLASKLGA